MSRAVKGLWGLAFLASAGVMRAEAPDVSVPDRLELSRAAQVSSGLHHWSGPRDGSLLVEARRQGDLLALDITLRDDVPFLQPRPAKLNPDWWKIEYGADGIRFILRTRQRPPQVRCDFYLNFGSQVTDPQIVVVSSESGMRGRMQGLRLKYARKGITTRLFLTFPLDRLLESPLSLEATEMEVRFYDLDGDLDEFTVLSDSATLGDSPLAPSSPGTVPDAQGESGKSE